MQPWQQDQTSSLKQIFLNYLVSRPAFVNVATDLIVLSLDLSQPSSSYVTPALKYTTQYRSNILVKPNYLPLSLIKTIELNTNYFNLYSTFVGRINVGSNHANKF